MLLPFLILSHYYFMFYSLTVTLALKAQHLKKENDSHIQMSHLSKERICECKNANKTTFKGWTQLRSFATYGWSETSAWQQKCQLQHTEVNRVEGSCCCVIKVREKHLFLLGG